MKRLFVLAVLAATPLPAFAETASPPANSATGGAEGEKKPDSVEERQRNSAAKLAGLVRFVDASCPDATPNYDRFKQVIAGMGVDIKELETGALTVRSIGYTEAYQKDAAESCKKALELFGENGTTVPGMIRRKTP